MGKKKRVWVYTGSLIQPLARYFLNLNIKLNSKDLAGSRIAETLFQQTIETKSKFLQPNLNVQYGQINDDLAEYAQIEIKFINGWDLKFNLQDAKYNYIIDQIKYHNQMIEGIRNEQDFDDEFEDEERVY